MQNDSTGLSGPDFLDAVANAEEAQGHSINASVYRQRAREWRQIETDHELAQQRIHEQSSELERARTAARRAATTLSEAA